MGHFRAVTSEEEGGLTTGTSSVDSENRHQYLDSDGVGRTGRQVQIR